MAFLEPNYDDYQPSEVLRVSHAGTFGTCEVYQPRKRSRDSELLIGIIHGWIGRGTLRPVASQLAEHGHTVFTVDHSGWRSNDRSRAVHEATKAATLETGMRSVLYMGHSMAAKDLLRAARYQHEKQPPNYDFMKLVTVDGLGTNDKPFNPLAMRKEAKIHAELLKSSPITYAEVIGRSAINLAVRPIPRMAEVAQAVFYNANGDVQALRQNGVEVEHIFHRDDGVIQAPDDDRGAVFEGGHLTFAISPDNARDIVDQV